MLNGFIAGQVHRWLESQSDADLLALVQREVLPRLTLTQKIKLADLVNTAVARDKTEWQAQAQRALGGRDG